LFLDGKPLHRGSFEAGSIEQEGLATLECHLPRVSRVRAIRVPPIGDVGSRILVCTDASLPASEVVSIAG
jgi:hypothetical protein